MNIPIEFRRRMESLTGDEMYFNKLGEMPFKGLRVNTLKAPRDLILKTFGSLKPVPFCDDGFYINEEISGNHPLHHAGVLFTGTERNVGSICTRSPARRLCA